MARDGKLDPVIGRAQEIETTIEVLARRKKNNPVLIGEPGWARQPSSRDWRSAW
jgi:ATP-dependent Clp protease ATP-binding subunit ClpA